MLEISVAKAQDKHHIMTLLNQTLLDMLEQGIRHWRYPWPATAVQQQINAQRRFVVKDNGALVGTFVLTYTNEYEEIDLTTKALVLAEMVFAPESQGQGYSEIVFAYCLEQAQKQNWSLYVASPVKHPRLEKLFSRYSFELWARSPKVYLYRYQRSAA